MANPRKPRPNRPGDEGAVLFRGPGAADSPVKLEGEALVVNVDSRTIVDVARRVALRKLRDLITEGKAPNGQAQKPLSARRLAQPGRVSDHRGYATGLLADELRASPIKGSTARAETTINPDPRRNVYLSQAAKAGVEHIGFGPDIDAAIVEAIDEALELMLDGLKVDAEQGQPTSKEESKSS